MIYNVRIREVLVHEIQVESESLKGAFLTAMRKAQGTRFRSIPVGRYFELESITKGKINDSTYSQSTSKKVIFYGHQKKHRKT